MKYKKPITALVILIVLISGLAASVGIFSSGGEGEYAYTSIRGETIQIYGKGIYKHMSADVAIQGIAQDVVTLFIAIPVLIIALIGSLRGSRGSRYLLAGSAMYFFITYLFYLAMGMYNQLFLVYAALIGLSFFSLFLVLYQEGSGKIREHFSKKAPEKFSGSFLVFNAVAIALLWLSVVVPPLVDGSVYPDSLDHYTTLIVQGYDLGLLLPVAMVSGILLIRKRDLGYLSGTTYLVFLSLLMTALTAKLIAMAMNGVSVVPAIYIIPLFALTSLVCAISMLRSIQSDAL
jgi:hypothetical protein